jgi:LPXTG-motif cell wall-anchored protein
MVGERTRITLTVSVLPAAAPSATNTATVGSGAEDVQPANNTSDDTVSVREAGGTPGGGGSGASDGPGMLPRTGATIGGLVAAALLLVGSGLGLIAASRRRRPPVQPKATA